MATEAAEKQETQMNANATQPTENQTEAARYEIQTDSPCGPRVLYDEGASAEEIELALPSGHTVDWSSQVRAATHDYSAPLVAETTTTARELFGLRTVEVAGDRARVSDGTSTFWVDAADLDDEVAALDDEAAISDAYQAWCVAAHADVAE